MCKFDSIINVLVYVSYDRILHTYIAVDVTILKSENISVKMFGIWNHFVQSNRLVL